VINQPGSYVLTSNLVVTDPNLNAIEITDSHVTLDLNGHMVRGPNSGGTGTGIRSLDQYNITIKNGSIWGFGSTGVHLFASGGVELAAGHCVKDIQAFLNGSGIAVNAGLVTNCTANNNGSSGISAHYTTVTNCTANNNGFTAFYSYRSTITNCTAINNFIGISAQSSTITNCMVCENDDYGITCGDSTITNCTAINNSGKGISATSSIITNCTATSNGSDGIAAYNWNRIEGNNLRNNGQGGTGYGLNIAWDYNYAVKNVASENASGNFLNSGSNNVMPLTGDNANYWSP
jgi:parallel beta-helix repeat protein